MAADQSAIRTATVTLAAATNFSIELTGPGNIVELVHHGNDTNVVYYDTYQAEPVDALTGGGAEEEDVLIPSERLKVNAARGEGESVWIELISAGTPTVTAKVIPRT